MVMAIKLAPATICMSMCEYVTNNTGIGGIPKKEINAFPMFTVLWQ